MSLLLFAIGIEQLARTIKENIKIHGINIGGKVYKIVLFADDILLTLTDSIESLKELTQVIEDLVQFQASKLIQGKIIIPSEHLTSLTANYTNQL